MPPERGARGEAVHVVDAEVEGDTPVPVAREARAKPVSYTHLTLPTNREV